MIPLTALYNYYDIDRPKLTPQKNPFEYIVPPRTKGGRNNKLEVNQRQQQILCVIFETIIKKWSSTKSFKC